MAAPTRLTTLPGYDDTARDIYETPQTADLTDSTTTNLTQQTSPTSPSATGSETSPSDSESESQGITRRRLQPNRARTKFSGTAITSFNGVDLSDRVDGRRRGYRVRSRRRKSGSEGEETEGLEARIARLRREIEECRVEAESELDFGGRDVGEGEIEGLRGLLDGVQSKVADRGASGSGDAVTGAGAGGTAPGAWPDRDHEVKDDQQLLHRVTDFDSRLAALETSLGISALDSAVLENGTDAVAMPVLPSLLLLDQQVAALSSATSLNNLESASAKIQKLKQDAEQLSQAQQGAERQTQSRPSTSHSSTKTPSGTSPIQSSTEENALLSSADTTQLQELYTLLPTLQSLSPTLPALLTRLRSLRTLHTQAATAASDLDAIEKRQAEMAEELKAWREGLERVEKSVQEASEGNGRNGRVVEGWVGGLEGRVKALK